MEITDSTIIIHGNASRSMEPEKTVIAISFKHTYADYLKACKALETNLKTIHEIADTSHIDRKDITTASYSIAKEEVPLKDKNNNYTGKKLLGYSLSQSVTITIGMDNRLMTDLLNGIIGCNPEAEISISYGLNDTTAVKDELLAEAVRNARRQAVCMAMAAGCKLGKVLQISDNSHFSDEDRFSTSILPAGLGLKVPKGRAFEEPLEANPRTITLSQLVTVIWKLEE